MAKKEYLDTPETLLAAVLSMQDKILEQLTEFEASELVLSVEMGDGRTITRPNPFVQEFRELVKDYTKALKAYTEITGTANLEASKKLDGLRDKFKLAT